MKVNVEKQEAGGQVIVVRAETQFEALLLARVIDTRVLVQPEEGEVQLNLVCERFGSVEQKRVG